MKRYAKLFLCWIALASTLNAFDQSVFYHGRLFPGEPRFSKPLLSSIDFKVSGGSDCRKNDEYGNKIKDLGSMYRTHQIIFTGTQNLCRGWFVSTTLPIYRIHAIENVTTPNPDGINFECTSVSNMNITGGWTINYEETEILDFVDLTLETGIILPTAKKPTQSKGIPFRAVGAVGIFDWISVGLQADAIMFFDKVNGRLWDVNFYVKADHFCRGFSFLLGYSHSDQKQSPVPWSKELLSSWTMDTFHFNASFDAASDEHPHAPRIEFFYNHVMNGKNVVENSIFGFVLGADF